ncbi:MAG: ATP-binding protein [Sphingomonadaceae bacterium]|nr:ATP-binding protein [Sphingomonadaceae bacterium]
MTDPLSRIADALDRLAPPVPPPADPARGTAFVFAAGVLAAVAPAPAQPLARFVGVDAQRDALHANLRRHASGAAAHDVLLWGARGMGKSSLVRSVHAALLAEGADLALVQVARDDLDRLPALFAAIGDTPRRFVVYADDVSFEADERQYKALRSVLDGGIAARPDSVRLVVTSNRRHLVAREHAETEAANAVNARDVLDDRLALADRFGLSLGFHNADQASYLAMVAGYAAAHGLAFTDADALAWAAGRGHRSGRVAWQYATELAGRAGRALVPA